MPKTPKPPAPIDYGAVAQQQVQSNIQGQQAGIDLSAINQYNPYGSLTYQRDASGKVTGATSQLSPEQQQILDYLQSNQQGIGGTMAGAIATMFPQYATDPNLIGQANSLTMQGLESQLPAWERFDAPARDQLRTQLLNQGLQEGSPAYQQQMDKLTNQQELTRGQWLANFEPAMFQQSKEQYELPLQNVATMFGMAQPASLPGQLVNTPQANVGAADLTGMAKASQDQAYKNYQQEVARQNMFMNMGIGIAGSALGMPVNPMNATYGSNLMKGLFG